MGFELIFFLKKKKKKKEWVGIKIQKCQNAKGTQDINCKVVIYNYVLCWLYSMTKSVVIALIYIIVFCGILSYWV